MSTPTTRATCKPQKELEISQSRSLKASKLHLPEWFCVAPTELHVPNPSSTQTSVTVGTDPHPISYLTLLTTLAHTHMHMHACTHTRTHARAHTHTHTHMHARTHAHTHILLRCTSILQSAHAIHLGTATG